MATNRMYTRTVQSMELSVLVADTEMGELKNVTALIPRIITNEATLDKAAKKAVETDTVRFVQVVEKRVIKGLYGVPEDKFMEIAVPLDPKTRKPITKS